MSASTWKFSHRFHSQRVLGDTGAVSIVTPSCDQSVGQRRRAAACGAAHARQRQRRARARTRERAPASGSSPRPPAWAARRRLAARAAREQRGANAPSPRRARAAPQRSCCVWRPGRAASRRDPGQTPPWLLRCVYAPRAPVPVGCSLCLRGWHTEQECRPRLVQHTPTGSSRDRAAACAPAPKRSRNPVTTDGPHQGGNERVQRRRGRPRTATRRAQRVPARPDETARPGENPPYWRSGRRPGPHAQGKRDPGQADHQAVHCATGGHRAPRPPPTRAPTQRSRPAPG